MSVLINTDSPPLVFVRAEGNVSIDGVEFYFAQRRKDFGLATPYAQVFDANSFTGMGFSERHLFSSHMKQVNQNYGVLSRGSAFVLESTAMRGIIRAILWASPSATPTKFFRDISEATNWARALVEDAPSLPPPRRSLSKAFRLS